MSRWREGSYDGGMRRTIEKYRIEYGPRSDRKVRKLKLDEIVPTLDELKAKGAVAVTIYSPDGQVADEYALRRAIDGLR